MVLLFLYSPPFLCLSHYIPCQSAADMRTFCVPTCISAGLVPGSLGTNSLARHTLPLDEATASNTSPWGFRSDT